MLVMICVQPICIFLLLWKKYSVPLQHRRNWCQTLHPTARRPSRVNGGTPILAARPQPTIRTQWPVPIWSTLHIKPAKPASPSHFLTNTPSPVSLDCPSKPFTNRHATISAVRHSRNSSTDYLPLQAILEPKCQALWTSPIIPHQITCPTKLFFNQHT